VAYERGERKELRHLQGIARLLSHEFHKEKLRRWLRATLLRATATTDGDDRRRRRTETTDGDGRPAV
jgi:hypothetical protein